MSLENKLQALQKELDQLSQAHCQCAIQIAAISADLATLRATLQGLMNL